MSSSFSFLARSKVVEGVEEFVERFRATVVEELEERRTTKNLVEEVEGATREALRELREKGKATGRGSLEKSWESSRG